MRWHATSGRSAGWEEWSIDLSEYAGRPIDGPLLREVTERIMVAITDLLEEIRGERAPAVRFDLRSSELPRTGDPRRPRRAS